MPYRRVTFAALAVATLFMTCVSSQEAESPVVSLEEYSYQLGMQVTSQVRQQLLQSGIPLDHPAFLRGVQDALESSQDPGASNEKRDGGIK